MASPTRRDFLYASCPTLGVLATARFQAYRSLSAYSFPPALIEPADLAAVLDDAAKRPLILCVGFPDMYKHHHVPHAQFAGQAGTDDGLKQLRATVTGVALTTPIVVYCGCCPIKICPNVHPAYKLLQSLKYTHVRMLNLPKDFHTDWEAKGYPVKQG